MTKKKRVGPKRKHPKGKSYYEIYKNTNWFKALQMSHKLTAAENQLAKYTKLVKELRLKVKRFK